MTAPLLTEHTVEHLDFAPACGATRTDDPEAKCPETAVAFVELHRVGACKHPGCNAAGNMSGLICQKHVDAFMALARDIIGGTPTDPSFPICFRRMLFCATCGKQINAVSDIIVRLEML